MNAKKFILKTEAYSVTNLSVAIKYILEQGLIQYFRF